MVADEGFDGTVLQVATRGVAVAALAEHALQVEAGDDWDRVVALDGRRGATPGWRRCPASPAGSAPPRSRTSAPTARRSPRPSAGSGSWTGATHDVVLLGPEECGFGYRDSVFKRSDRYVVLAVAFALEHSRLGAPVRYAELARRLGVEVGDAGAGGRRPGRRARAAPRQGHGARRRRPRHLERGLVLHQPGARRRPRRPRLPGDRAALARADDGRVKISAAWLIEQAGFGKGYGSGAARVSTKHTLALTNRGGATTAELLALAREIRDGVRDRFGVTLVPEPVLVGATL